ncbi:hypothetical protein ACHAW5_003080 [Stephanodiscus triporus]|uniref:Uncharacterized protein n=1 Tax=Stephanodiscus triporus TaxID=2934178 RepID=A0ABD3MD47_9STRA
MPTKPATLALLASLSLLSLLLLPRVAESFSPRASTTTTTTRTHPAAGRAVVLAAPRPSPIGATVGRENDDAGHTTTATTADWERTSSSSSSSSLSNRRREILRSSLLVVASAGPASAADNNNNARPPPVVPLPTTARRLRAVPTFAIVDGDGVPFHTYDKDSAGGYGYFFVSYRSAEYVLEDARSAFAKAKAGEGRGSCVIVTEAARGRAFDTYYQVIPSQEEQNAALRIEDGPRYRERGRVPLFYVDGLTLMPDDPLAAIDATAASSASGGEGGSAGGTTTTTKAGASIPVYFRVQDLRDEWQRQHPDAPLPTIRVRELNETFRAMIRPGGKDVGLRDLVFVPSPDSVERARAIVGGKYKLGEMILTK